MHLLGSDFRRMEAALAAAGAGDCTVFRVNLMPHYTLQMVKMVSVMLCIFYHIKQMTNGKKYNNQKL